jgi:fluoride exporter
VLVALVGVGGMAGTYARYRLGGAIHSRLGPSFPWGTLSVNVTGSFVLGLLLPVLGAHGPLTSIRALIAVGFLGAFTTFSSFAYEAAMLVTAGERARAGTYAAASLGLGLVALIAGLVLGRALL